MGLRIVSRKEKTPESKELSQVISATQQERRIAESLQSEVNALGLQKEELLKEIDKVNKKLSSINLQISKKQTQLLGVIEDAQDSKSQLDVIGEALLEANEKFKSETLRLEQKLTELSSQIKPLEQEIAKLSSKKDTLEHKIEELSIIKDELLKENRGLKADSKKVVSFEEKELEKIASLKEQAQVDIEVLKLEKGKAQEEVSVIKSESSVLELKLGELKVANDLQEQENKKLNADLKNISDQLIEKKEAMISQVKREERLNKLQNVLEAHYKRVGLEFKL
jgi:chromosome segregation ATPase